MNRYAVTAGGVVLFFLAFWLGLKLNFPGEAVTRFVKSRTSQLREVDIRLSPAALGFTGIYFDFVEIRSADATDTPPLLKLNEVKIPFSWRLPMGLVIAGKLGEEGRLSIFIPWWAGGTAEILGFIDIQEISIPPELGPLKLAGSLELTGKFEMKQPLGVLTEVPDGTIAGTAKGLQVRGVSYSGIELPITNVESATWTMKSGKVVNLEQLVFNGDVQGSIKGLMTPNMKAPLLSSLRLEGQVTPSKVWLEKLGNLRPIVESFVKQGRVAFILEGSLARLRFIEGNAP